MEKPLPDYENFLSKRKQSLKAARQKQVEDMARLLKNKDQAGSVKATANRDIFEQANQHRLKKQQEILSVQSKKNELVRARQKLEQSRKRAQEAWDFSGFFQGVAIFADAFAQQANQAMQYQSAVRQYKKDTSWRLEREKDPFEDPAFNRRMTQALSQRSRLPVSTSPVRNPWQQTAQSGPPGPLQR